MGEPEQIVYVVEDDEGVRALVQALTLSIPVRCQTFESAQAFLDAYDPAQPGCLVLDLFMPGMSGLDLQEELNRRGAMIPVVFMTAHADVPTAVEAMQHGAFNYLQKPFRNSDLIDSVRKALARDHGNREVLAQMDSVRERIFTLTPREREVLEMLARGHPNKIMAREMGLSQRTVELHRARVMEKMQASSIAHLVRMLMEFERRTAGPTHGAP